MMFLISILLHLIDDFYLQLASFSNLKQKQWWINECKKHNVDYDFYKDDYLMALFLHGLEWSIMISLPFILSNGFNSTILAFCVMTNAFIHAIIDHLKANLFKINLLIDQTLHVGQILLLYYIMFNV